MRDFLQTIIKEAGVLAKEYFIRGVSSSEKSNRADLLTEADLAVNNFLIKKIQDHYPDHHIHSEESPEDINPGAEYEWVIDPIDGTRNFALGIPFWCQLVAVMRAGKPYLGAVYAPISDTLFFGEADHGAYLNGNKISVNSVGTLDHAFVAMYRNPFQQYNDRFSDALDKLNKEHTSWQHNYGCMLIACYVATGGVDIYAVNAGKDHDYLAPALICAEAGAIVSNCDGEPWTRGRPDIVIANPFLHKKVLELLK